MMEFRQCSRILLVASMATICGSAASQSPPTTNTSLNGRERLLYTKRLDDGSNILLYAKQLGKSGLANILNNHDYGQLAATICYSAEVFPKDKSEPLTVWSAVDQCNVGWSGKDGSEVLDLGCGNDQFLFVTWRGGDIWCYYADYRGLPQSGEFIIPPDWTIYPVKSTPFDRGTTVAKLSMNKDNSWGLHIVQRDGQRGLTTDFVKPAEKWEFQLVKSIDDPKK